MKRLTLLGLVGFSCAAISLSGQQPASIQPDQIFYNGKIITVDAGNTIQEAFATKGDRFLAIGTNSRIRAMGGPQTMVVNLNGRTVVPGLADGHAHPWRHAFQNLRGVDMTGVTSLQEMGDRIRTAAAAASSRRTIARTEALRVLTSNAAYVTFEEHLKGSIEPDKLADFVVLSQDVLTVPEDQIRATQALETYAGGRRVFAR